eukprot:scpid81785/ scgid29018/ 
MTDSHCVNPNVSPICTKCTRRGMGAAPRVQDLPHCCIQDVGWVQSNGISPRNSTLFTMDWAAAGPLLVAVVIPPTVLIVLAVTGIVLGSLVTPVLLGPGVALASLGMLLATVLFTGIIFTPDPDTDPDLTIRLLAVDLLATPIVHRFTLQCKEYMHPILVIIILSMMYRTIADMKTRTMAKASRERPSRNTILKRLVPSFFRSRSSPIRHSLSAYKYRSNFSTRQGTTRLSR